MLNSITILIDSREKKNQHILSYFDKHKIPYCKMALTCGDYSFKIPKNNSLGFARDKFFHEEIFIERKSSADELAGNFTTSRSRFEEEFAISQAGTKYLMIENCTYQDIISGNYKSDYSNKSYLGSLHTFNHRYNLQVFFMPNKEHSPIFIYGVFKYYLRNILK